MKTVIETPLFEKQAAAVWSEDERDEFILNFSVDHAWNNKYIEKTISC
jgi:hypothetical protein